MNRHPRARRRRFMTAAAAATLLGVLILVTACSSSSSDETPSAADQAPAAGGASAADQEQALQFAQCMRENGVPDFPDPDAEGRFSEGEHDQDDPALRAAQEACRDLAPGGEHENTGDPAFVEQMREFSQCMRDNGLPDFPDPDADGRLRGRSHELQGDPQFQAARETCRDKLPGGGEH
jgi:hypothetical protein